MAEMTIEKLRELLTDKRVKLFTAAGVYYAEVIEENGDAFDLARSTSVDDLHRQLVEMRTAAKDE